MHMVHCLVSNYTRHTCLHFPHNVHVYNKLDCLVETSFILFISYLIKVVYGQDIPGITYRLLDCHHSSFSNSKVPLCSQCAPNVLPMCSQCAPNVLPMCSLCAPNVLPMCSQCAPNVLLMCSPSAPHVLPMCSPCAPHVLPMCSQCAPNVLPMCS